MRRDQIIDIVCLPFGPARTGGKKTKRNAGPTAADDADPNERRESVPVGCFSTPPSFYHRSSRSTRKVHGNRVHSFLELVHSSYFFS